MKDKKELFKVVNYGEIKLENDKNKEYFYVYQYGVYKRINILGFKFWWKKSQHNTKSFAVDACEHLYYEYKSKQRKNWKTVFVRP